MGTVHFNGLHWNNWGVISSHDKTLPQPQYKAGQQFSAAYIIASCDINNNPYNPNAFNGFQTGYNNWKDVVNWIKGNTSRTGEIVLRLYWPGTGSSQSAMNGNIGPALGNAFYDGIVKPAVGLGITNFQVLNELNLEYSKTPSQLAGDLYNIAYFIKQRAQADNLGFIALGFPGPGGDPANAVYQSSSWNSYWSNYASVITQNTGIANQGNAFNWLGVHSYAYTAFGNPSSTPPDAGLSPLMKAQYNSLVSKFPGYPMRYTEYSINQDASNVNWQARADACKSAIVDFKNYVAGRSPAGPDVWSLFYWIAFDSADPAYHLVQNNSSLSPATSLANAF